ncbi:TPA: hypothetical protein DEB00_02965 [Candidatus Uhrbacteria bacterium]|nr:hypothetical protein [Candidatus Uhrbacteria bacterium]
MDHEQNPDTQEEPCCSSPHAPRGASSFGWLWVVGIIVVVALILFFLQGRVPDANAPTIDSTEPELTQEVPAIQEDNTEPADEMIVEPATEDEPVVELIIE